MGLVVYWYSTVCFVIVGVALVGSVYIIWRREFCARNYHGDGDDSTTTSTLNTNVNQSLGASQLPRGYVNSGQAWSTCWRGLHPVWLLALRFASFVIMSAFLAWDILDSGTSVYIYYTEWTFTLVSVYFAIGTIVSVRGCMVYDSKKKRQKADFDNGQKEELLRRDVDMEVEAEGDNSNTNTNSAITSITTSSTKFQIADFWGYCIQIVYQTCAGAVIMTDLVFWCIIVPFLSIAHLQLDLLMGCMHILNAVFLLLDTAVSSLPFTWFGLAYFVLWSCCYVIFQWLIHACGYSTWPYPFLELSTPWAPLWYTCLAVAHIPCYGLYWLLIRAKNSIFSALFPLSFANH
ncbi:hypothetical protein NMG60_11013725 [Bertholletia excelsa]